MFRDNLHVSRSVNCRGTQLVYPGISAIHCMACSFYQSPLQCRTLITYTSVTNSAWQMFLDPEFRKRVRNGHEQPQQHRQRRQQQHSGGRDSDCSKGAITSTIKHAIKHKTSTARLAQLDGTPSLAASYSKMLMRAATVVQQLRKSCRTCFMFHCMFYFTCDRSLTSLAAAACHVRRCLFTLQYDAYG